jgi:hypothetical protein
MSPTHMKAISRKPVESGPPTGFVGHSDGALVPGSKIA